MLWSTQSGHQLWNLFVARINAKCASMDILSYQVCWVSTDGSLSFILSRLLISKVVSEAGTP